MSSSTQQQASPVMNVRMNRGHQDKPIYTYAHPESAQVVVTHPNDPVATYMANIEGSIMPKGLNSIKPFNGEVAIFDDWHFAFLNCMGMNSAALAFKVKPTETEALKRWEKADEIAFGSLCTCVERPVWETNKYKLDGKTEVETAKEFMDNLIAAYKISDITDAYKHWMLMNTIPVDTNAPVKSLTEIQRHAMYLNAKGYGIDDKIVALHLLLSLPDEEYEALRVVFFSKKDTDLKSQDVINAVANHNAHSETKALVFATKVSGIKTHKPNYRPSWNKNKNSHNPNNSGNQNNGEKNKGKQPANRNGNNQKQNNSNKQHGNKGNKGNKKQNNNKGKKTDNKQKSTIQSNFNNVSALQHEFNSGVYVHMNVVHNPENIPLPNSSPSSPQTPPFIPNEPNYEDLPNDYTIKLIFKQNSELYYESFTISRKNVNNPTILQYLYHKNKDYVLDLMEFMKIEVEPSLDISSSIDLEDMNINGTHLNSTQMGILARDISREIVQINSNAYFLHNIQSYKNGDTWHKLTPFNI